MTHAPSRGNPSFPARLRAGFFFLVAACLAVGLASAAERAERPFLHPLFANHMVLQREAPVPVWGWTEPGTPVRVTVARQTAEAIADADGRWQVTLAPLAGRGPFFLRVEGAKERRVLENILVGDVWVCAGQSNMDFPLQKATGGAAALADSEDDGLRIFQTPRSLAFAPRADFADKNRSLRWQVASPDTLAQGGGFSAAGYFFGRQLRSELRVPIGLLQCTWGGSPAEAWMPRESLLPVEGFPAKLAPLDRAAAERAAGITVEEQTSRWWQRTDAGTSATPAWSAPEFDDTGWKTLRLPGTWEDAGFGPFRGITWLRREFDLPAGAAAQAHRLLLGEIGTTDAVWINGKLIGETAHRHRERIYPVPEGILRPGKNQIAIRVLNHGKGGFFPCPDHVRENKTGDLLLAPETGAPVVLNGAWRSDTGGRYDAADPFPLVFDVEPTVPSMCYNGMVAPLAPFAIKGVLWYQGEANATRAQEYRTLLPALIDSWRARFSGGQFPFLIVQLPAAGEPERPPGVFPWAEMRESQEWVAESTPACGLAVTLDTGDKIDGHPPDKEPVGRRLALLAESLVYGRDVVASGPVFLEATFDTLGAHVRFAPNGPRRSDGELRAAGELRGFELAAADGVWTPASAALDGDGHVRVLRPERAGAPVAVRYAWRNFPEANLTNQAALPARPFRSDRTDWPTPKPPAAGDPSAPSQPAALPPAATRIPPELFANAANYCFAYREDGMQPMGKEDRSPLTFRASRFGLSFAQDRLAIDSLSAPLRSPSLPDLLAEVPAPLPKTPGWDLRLTLKTPEQDYPVLGGPIRQADQQAVEACQYFQRRFLKSLRMTEGAPQADATFSGLEIAAWPDSLTLRWNFRPLAPLVRGGLEISLGLPAGWRCLPLAEGALVVENPLLGEAFLVVPAAGGTLRAADGGRRIVVATEETRLDPLAELNTGLRLVPLSGLPPERWHEVLEEERHPLAVTVRQTFPDALLPPSASDADLGCVRISQPNTRERLSVNDAFVRLRLDLKNPSPRSRSVRLWLDSTREVAMPGMSNLLTDSAGNPLGLPVALTKNWHDNVADRFMGPWARRFLVLTLPPHGEVTLGLAQIYAWWAGMPAASVAHLSCVGYPGNQQNWGQAAIGGWQESMTFWPSPSAGGANICDVRPFLAHGTNAPKWGWSGNLGGGSWLRYEVAGQPIATHRVLDHYAVQMPNLSSVTYRTVTTDGAIASRNQATLTASDDCLRVFFRIRHDVLKTTRFSRLAWFQLGADGYNYAISDRIAIGTRDGLTDEWPSGEKAGWQRRQLPLPGPVPWISLHGTDHNDHTHPLRPDQVGACAHDQATRGLIVRRWLGKVRGQDVTTPSFSILGHEAFSPVTTLAELTPPSGVDELLAGDYQEADLEWVMFPSRKLRYHGPDRAFAEAIETTADTWKPVHREARGNDLELSAEGAEVLDRYPVRLRRHPEAGSVRFRVSGGLGLVPVSIENLPGYTNPTLEHLREGRWVPVLPGPDAKQGGWQSRFDATTRTWAVDFNLPSHPDSSANEYRFRVPSAFPVSPAPISKR